MTIKNRLAKLESSQPRQTMCRPLAWFYREAGLTDAEHDALPENQPVPFDLNKTLSDFYREMT